MRIAYERLRARLDQLVHGRARAARSRSRIITLRNGRYVIPVRADAKRKVRGIVHDQSGSGQTLFIEPLVAVELGNAWREAQLKVQAEEERILDELSALVAAQAAALRETLDALARFDFWAARARLAAELDGDPRRDLDGAESCCCRRATRAVRARSCPSTCGSATTTRRSSSRAPTRAARRSRCGPSGCCA